MQEEPVEEEWQDPMKGTRVEVDILIRPGDKLGLRLRDMQGGGSLVIGFATQGCMAQVEL